MTNLERVLHLPLAEHGAFELYDDEIRTLRSRIYSLNGNNASGARWRTSRLPLTSRPARSGYADTNKYTLLVWRVK